MCQQNVINQQNRLVKIEKKTGWYLIARKSLHLGNKSGSVGLNKSYEHARFCQKIHQIQALEGEISSFQKGCRMDLVVYADLIREIAIKSCIAVMTGAAHRQKNTL